MQSLKQAIFGALAAGALSGCILSDKPLFPSGALKAQTPIAQGWYVKQESYDRDGSRKFSVSLKPTYMRQTGDVYDYYEDDRKIERRFQMFASSPKEAVFIAQSSVGKSGWGYQRVDVTEDRSFFAVTETRCNEMDEDARGTLQGMGVLGPLKDGNCRVTDAVGASVTVLKGGNFPRAKLTSYVRIADERIFTVDKISNGPKTSLVCPAGGEYPVQSFSSAHGLPGDGTAVRRHNIATTRTPDTSLQFSFAVEAEGDKLHPWGYIGLANEKTSRAYCSSMHLVRIERWLPDAVEDVAGARPERIANRCAKMDTRSCGSLAQMASRYAGRVLAQGREVYVFPGNGLAYGHMLTIIGSQGFGHLTVLRTESDGTTYAVMERG